MEKSFEKKGFEEVSKVELYSNEKKRKKKYDQMICAHLQEYKIIVFSRKVAHENKSKLNFKNNSALCKTTVNKTKLNFY